MGDRIDGGVPDTLYRFQGGVVRCLKRGLRSTTPPAAHLLSRLQNSLLSEEVKEPTPSYTLHIAMSETAPH